MVLKKATTSARVIWRWLGEFELVATLKRSEARLNSPKTFTIRCLEKEFKGSAQAADLKATP